MNTPTQHTNQYKNSPLGLIPDDWEVKLFSEVFDYINTPSFSRDNLTNEKTEKEVKYIHYGDIHSTFKTELLDIEKDIIPYLKDEFVDENKLNFLNEGDLVIADASEDYKGIGECVELKNVKNNKIIGGLHTIVARSRDNQTHNGFRTYIFNSHLVSKSLKTIATGISVYGISKGNLSKLKLPIPPLPEQKAIADCLSTWDKVIEKQTDLIAQKELSKKALMQQLLSGKKRLKGFVGKWHLKSLEEVATFKNGKAHENGIDENGDYKVVNSKFVSTNGNVFKSSNENLCPLFINEIAMVMSDIPNGKALAKCFYVTENNKYTLNQRICSIRSNKETNSKFLYYILNRNVHYLSFDNGVGQTNLKKEEVLECPLLMPEKEEQTAIANVLQCADTEIQLLKNKLIQLKEQKKGLMQVLLTGKKRLKN